MSIAEASRDTYASRAAARRNCGRGERVVKLGTFAGGSFGLYPPIRSCGLYVGQVPGGPIPLITVWAVRPK